MYNTLYNKCSIILVRKLVGESNAISKKKDGLRNIHECGPGLFIVGMDEQLRGQGAHCEWNLHNFMIYRRSYVVRGRIYKAKFPGMFQYVLHF